MKRGDLVWCLFGDGLPNPWWWQLWLVVRFWRSDPDEVTAGTILDAFDDGLVIVSYGHDERVVTDWFNAEQAAKQLRPRTA